MVDCIFSVSDGLLDLLLVVIVERPVSTSLQKQLLIESKNATIEHVSNSSPNSPQVGVSHTTDRFSTRLHVSFEPEAKRFHNCVVLEQVTTLLSNK